LGEIIRWFVEDIGTALVDPRSLIAISRVERRGLGEPLLFVTIFSSATAVSISAPIVTLLTLLIPLELGLAIHVLLIALGIVGGIALWLVDSVLLHALSKIFGGEGRMYETTIAVGYSFAATWPIALMGLISSAIGWLSGMFLVMLGIAIEIVWRWYILSQSLSEVHGFSALRGLLVVILARAILVVLAFIIGMASITAWFGLRW